MIEAILSGLMRPNCPDCGARQAVMMKYGVRWRVRKVKSALPCPGCGTELQLGYTHGAGFEIVLGLAAMLAFVLGLTALVDAMIARDLGGFAMLAGLIGLLVMPIVALGLVLRFSRKVIRKTPEAQEGEA